MFSSSSKGCHHYKNSLAASWDRQQQRREERGCRRTNGKSMESMQRGTQSKDSHQRRIAQYGMYDSALLNCCNTMFGTRPLVSKSLWASKVNIGWVRRCNLLYTGIVVALYRTYGLLFDIFQPALTCMRGQQRLACGWLVWLGGRRDSRHVQEGICIHSIPTNVKVIA